MNRQQIIERLYELKEDDRSADQLYNKLIKKWITNEEAEVELRKIDPDYISKDFLSTLEGKPVYKSISDYKNGKLSNIQIAKMVSSLITQILIQNEKSGVSCKALQIDALSDILKSYYESDGEVIDTHALDELLVRYGWPS